MEEVQRAGGLWGPSVLTQTSTEFDESLIGLGKHPQGVCLRTKRAILSFLVEASALRSDKSRLVSGYLGLAQSESKTWCDSRGAQGYINLNLNVHRISRNHFALPLNILFQQSTKYFTFAVIEHTKKKVREEICSSTAQIMTPTNVALATDSATRTLTLCYLQKSHWGCTGLFSLDADYF